MRTGEIRTIGSDEKSADPASTPKFRRGRIQPCISKIPMVTANAFVPLLVMDIVAGTWQVASVRQVAEFGLQTTPGVDFTQIGDRGARSIR